MTEQELELTLVEMFQDISFHDDGDDEEPTVVVPEALARIRHVDTFEDVGLLSGNRGLVLRMADGSEFQITIVQSR